MNRVDKLIQIIHQLREEGTMTTQSSSGNPGFSSSSDPEGPTAGFDPLLGKFKNKKKLNNIDFRKVPKIYKCWVKYLGNK